MISKTGCIYAGVFLLSSLFPLCAAEAGFRVPPYLQNPSADGMTVVWFSEEATPGRLIYRQEGEAGEIALTSAPVPKPPWFEERQGMIVWDDLRHPDVRAYLERYWAHQVEYRLASTRWRNGDLDSLGDFPELCFIPGRRPRPIAHMEGSAA